MAEALRSVRQLDFIPQHDVFPSPADWRDVFVYFLLVDRFDNNRRGLRPHSAAAPQGRDPEQGKIFQGGNLNGIVRRLNYIKGLGANAIWLSPVFKNRSEKADSYHGYGIQNFLEVDPRFGTAEDLQKLVREAHARGMYVILDIILIIQATTGPIRAISRISSPSRPSTRSISAFGAGMAQRRIFKTAMRYGRRSCSARSATKGAGKSATGAISRRRSTVTF